MPKSGRLLAVLCAAAVSLPLVARAAEDKPTPKTPETMAEKATDKAPPQEVTTQGTLDAGGEHIAYNAVAGTITVGATDEQDAQLGPDGKPLTDTDLAAAVESDPIGPAALGRASLLNELASVLGLRLAGQPGTVWPEY